MKWHLALITLSTFLPILDFPPVQAQPVDQSLCGDLVKSLLQEFQAEAPKAPSSSRAPAFQKLKFHPDPFEQWLLWEETKNINMMSYPTAERRIVAYPFDEKEGLVYYSDKTSPEAKEKLKNMFFDSGKVFIPVHPFAKVEENGETYNIPGLNPLPEQSKASKEFSVRHTASRSLAFPLEGHQFSLKLPTNFTADTRSSTYQAQFHHQPAKAKLIEDIFQARAKLELIHKVDEKIGTDPSFTILEEAMTLYHRPSQNGFVIRDLSPLQDGNYYLPAFSISSVGKKIASYHGESFDAFWAKHFAELLGRTQAKLLLRYGLQLQTPNSQNMLIALDAKTMRPLKMVLRDIGDSRLVRPVLQALDPVQAAQALEREEKFQNQFMPPGSHLVDEVPFVFSKLSFFGFDKLSSEETQVPVETINQWQNKLLDAYREEINQSLQVKIQPNYDPRKIADYIKRIQKQRDGAIYLDRHMREYALMVGLDEFFNSPEGKMRLADYRRSLILQNERNNERDKERKREGGEEKDSLAQMMKQNIDGLLCSGKSQKEADVAIKPSDCFLPPHAEIHSILKN